MARSPASPSAVLLSLVMSAVCASVSPAARAQSPRGVVLTAPPMPSEPVVSGARAAGEVAWEPHRLVPQPAPPSLEPEESFARLRTALVEGHFSACLAAIQEPDLDVERLLSAGLRETAGHVLAIAASCAYQAGNESVARQLLARATSAELSLAGSPYFVDPNLERVLEALERDQGARVTLTLRTEPVGAAIAVDGRTRACGPPSCQLSLRRGVHIVTASMLGFRVREAPLALEQDEERAFSLDRASSEDVLQQLAVELGRGTPPDDPRFIEAASIAHATRLLIVGWQGDSARLALFDLDADQPAVREAVTGEGLAVAAERLVRRWRDLQPTPLVEEPAFWIVAGAVLVAAVAGGAAAIALQPDPQFNIVGR